MHMRTAEKMALLILLATAGGARADEVAAGVLTRAPAVVEPAAPEYPEEAKAQGISGEVVLELDVSAEGEVLQARVVKPGGHGFDEAALGAARKLRFSPAEIDGEPAGVTIEYRFRFDAPPPQPPAAPTAVLRGVVVERGTREPLARVAVMVGDATVHTDREGRFEILGLPPGQVTVIALDPGYHRFETEEALEEGKALEVRYYLRRSEADPYEAVVVGQREKKEVTSVTLTSGEVTRVAGVSGDTVKIVQNLPGVARAPGGFGMLVVRGGNPTDTGVYVDGVAVPLIFHFGGLTSIVPSELVEAVDFEAGNFGVRFGRATGGLVNLRIRDPGERRLHLVADGNLYHALAMAEGPASQSVSVAIAARRSYADAMISAAAKSSDAFGVSVAPRYYDFQGKLAWHVTPDDAVRLSLYGADDRTELTGVKTGGLEDLDRLRFRTAFMHAAVSWDHRFSDAARARIAVAEGFYDVSYEFGGFASERDLARFTTARAEASRDLGAVLTLAAGMDTLFVPGASISLEYPEIPPPNRLPSPEVREIRTHLRMRVVEAGLWAEATWKPVDGLVVVPGIRADREVFEAAIRENGWFDTRIAARFTPRGGTTLKGGAGLYHQSPEPLMYRLSEWGNPDLHEEGAWQYMIGAEHRIFGPITADLQLYYKSLFDLVLPTDAVIERDGRLVEERYTNGGTGRSYGAELLLRWNPGGRFFGWLAYSLSRSVRDQKVVGGTVMPSGDAFDQPHNLVALGTMDLPELWDGFSTGFRVRYSTGNPYRRNDTAVYDADADLYRPVLEASASGRIPDFFQLDLRADKRWTYRTWLLSAYLEVQNVTNRKNAEAVAYNYDYSERGWATGLPLFPSFGIRAEY
jgi:TonB family protein